MEKWYKYILQVMLGLCSCMPIVAMNINIPVLNWQLKNELLNDLNENDIQHIKYLLDTGIISVHSRSGRGNTPLHYAAEQGKMKAIALLLDRGANIESKDDIGVTPLHVAAFNGNAEAIILLLDRGANIESKYNSEETPISMALNKLNSENITKKEQGQRIIDLIIRSKLYYINMSKMPSTLLGTVIMHLLKKSKERNNQHRYDYISTAQQVAIQLHGERARELLNTLRTASTLEEQKQAAKRYLKQYIERQDSYTVSELAAIPLRKEGLREITGHIHSLKDVIHLRK